MESSSFSYKNTYIMVKPLLDFSILDSRKELAVDTLKGS